MIRIAVAAVGVVLGISPAVARLREPRSTGANRQDRSVLAALARIHRGGRP